MNSEEKVNLFDTPSAEGKALKSKIEAIKKGPDPVPFAYHSSQ
jgi:hypothetical protein